VIVVDSNVIGYLHIPGERSDDADLALRKDPHWVATKLMDEALQLMAGHERDVDSARVLGLAAESGCSAYDCEFVSLAKDLRVALVTVDKQILSRFPDTAVALDRYAAAALRP